MTNTRHRPRPHHTHTLALLASLADQRAEVEDALSESVTRARLNGYSWAQIAGALGVTRQAAQKRYGGKARAV